MLSLACCSRTTRKEQPLQLCLFYVDLQLDATEIPDFCGDIQCLYDGWMNRSFSWCLGYINVSASLNDSPKMERSRKQGSWADHGVSSKQTCNILWAWTGPFNSDDLTWLPLSQYTFSQLHIHSSRVWWYSFLCLLVHCLFIVLLPYNPYSFARI